ncbi:hypothetical protein SB912_29305, partial [Pantoea sp. SIMBA_072]
GKGGFRDRNAPRKRFPNFSSLVLLRRVGRGKRLFQRAGALPVEDSAFPVLFKLRGFGIAVLMSSTSKGVALRNLMRATDFPFIVH